MNWDCPKCDAWMKGPQNRMHNCPGMAGLAMYFQPVGVRTKITANEREDYIGPELVRLNWDGQPIMSVTTEREDGQDCVVYAPVAVANGKVN